MEQTTDPDKISVEIKPFDNPRWKYIMAAILASSKVQMFEGSFKIRSYKLDVYEYGCAGESVQIQFDIPTFAPYKCFADLVKEEFLKLEMLSDTEIAKKVYDDIFNNTLDNKSDNVDWRLLVQKINDNKLKNK